MLKALPILLIFSYLTLPGHSRESFFNAPVISSFSPGSGPVGTLLRITGSNLASPTNVAINGTALVLVSQSETEVVCLVMPGTTSGAISLTTAGGTANSASPFSITATPWPAIQQGSRLQTPLQLTSALGHSVAISADGNTLISGAPVLDSYQGGGLVFTRNNGSWNPEGIPLVGSGSVGSFNFQGQDVALSADGNTALVSSAADNTNVGATWVFVRDELGEWYQEGNKLVGNGTGRQEQGASIAISADGNTAVIGAPYDNNETGACYVFTRNGSNWTQMGSKLVGTGGSTTKPRQGDAVAISADGSTILVNGLANGSGEGAFYLFTRNGNTWTQTPTNLVSTVGLTGVTSVALSADGKTAMVGNYLDGSTGAAWVYSLNGNNWTQLGGKLVGTGGASKNQDQGYAVSLSADGRIAMLGGPGNLIVDGAAWVFRYDGSQWVQQGQKLVGTPLDDGGQFQGNAVALSADGSTAVVGGPGVAGSIDASLWIFAAAAPSKTYTFTGNGNWNSPSNWSGGNVPPAVLPAGDTILIDPEGAGECVLNGQQTISKGATLRVEPGKRFRVTGNLVVTQ